jgi:phosphohistidine phosphatase SixA/8-oxo-dGTP pyrophosphatase MutT (NUDIX family)
MSDEVRAAGGIVRRRVDGRVETVLVHRPRYDDWSFPKGKLLDGESFEEAALREVEEETGLRCRIGDELPSARYRDASGSPKVVRYWSMDVEDGWDLRPTMEVDEARWLGLREARAALTIERDREVLDALLAWDAPAHLVRHAKAGDRSAWQGDHDGRPLSKAGRRQARALVEAFAGQRVDRILSSPAVRCVQTIEPLAEVRGVPVEVRDELGEGAPLDGFLALLDRLAASPTVLSGHGDLIPEAVLTLEDDGLRVGAERAWKKGAIWTLEREGGLFVRATYRPPPVVR